MCTACLLSPVKSLQSFSTGIIHQASTFVIRQSTFDAFHWSIQLNQLIPESKSFPDVVFHLPRITITSPSTNRNTISTNQKFLKIPQNSIRSEHTGVTSMITQKIVKRRCIASFHISFLQKIKSVLFCPLFENMCIKFFSTQRLLLSKLVTRLTNNN